MSATQRDGLTAVASPRGLISPGLVIALLLVLATVAVYWPVQRHDFILWDDPGYIYENRQIARGVTFDGLRWALTDTHMGHWHPLTWLSHMGYVGLFGLDPAGHASTVETKESDSVRLHLTNSIISNHVCHQLIMLHKSQGRQTEGRLPAQRTDCRHIPCGEG